MFCSFLFCSKNYDISVYLTIISASVANCYFYEKWALFLTYEGINNNSLHF